MKESWKTYKIMMSVFKELIKEKIMWVYASLVIYSSQIQIPPGFFLNFLVKKEQLRETFG